MGYYTRDEIPFQYVLAESFTICDAYHCSVTSGTDPNRIVFFSGSNFNPELRGNGKNSTDAESEPTICAAGSPVRCRAQVTPIAAQRSNG